MRSVTHTGNVVHPPSKGAIKEISTAKSKWVLLDRYIFMIKKLDNTSADVQNAESYITEVTATQIWSRMLTLAQSRKGDTIFYHKPQDSSQVGSSLTTNSFGRYKANV